MPVTISFKCAGDLGDIIAGLPVVKYFGGGYYFLEAAMYTRVMLTPDNWRGIDILLKAQPYIKDVGPWNNQGVTYNLNDFRARMNKSVLRGLDIEKNLVTWHLETFNIPLTAADDPWLSVPDPVRVRPVVVNRSGHGRDWRHAYHNWQMPWPAIMKKYAGEMVFIGTPAEHEAFCYTCGPIPYQPTEDLYEAAQVIAGCELFIGNQSCPHMIAQAMKKRVVLEVCEMAPNVLFDRPGVFNIRNYKTELPAL